MERDVFYLKDIQCLYSTPHVYHKNVTIGCIVNVMGYVKNSMLHIFDKYYDFLY